MRYHAESQHGGRSSRTRYRSEWTILLNDSIFNSGPTRVAYSHVPRLARPRLCNPISLCGPVAQTCPISQILTARLRSAICALIRFEKTLARLQQQAQSPAEASHASDVVPVEAPYTSTWSVSFDDAFGQYKHEISTILRLGGSVCFLLRGADSMDGVCAARNPGLGDVPAPTRMEVRSKLGMCTLPRGRCAYRLTCAAVA